MDREELTLQLATDLIEDAIPAGYEETRAFAQLDDHWQDGDAWIGPPASTPALFTKEVRAQVHAQFTPRNAIGEVLDRIENALLKREPAISVIPLVEVEVAEGEEEEEDEVANGHAALLAQWWDTADFHAKLKLATRIARWAGRAYLRPWVAPADKVLKGEERQIPSGSFDKLLSIIRVEVAEPGSAVIHVDPETAEETSIFKYMMGESEFVEVSWVDENQLTQVRIIGEKSTEEYAFDLGGRLMLVELRADVLITESVRRQQKRLNFFETVLNRNVETGGFPERVLTNSEPEVILVPRQMGQPVGPYPTVTQGGVTYEKRPVPRTLGSGVTSEIRGILYKDTDGNEQITTPGVHRFEPVDPALTIGAARHAYQVLLEETKQGHILINGDATASGVSRQQARSDFEDDLSNTASAVETATRKVHELVIALAGEFSKSRQILDKYRVIANLFVSSGPITPGEALATAELRDRGLLSLETAMLRAAGVEDAQAEMERIRQEPGGELSLMMRQAELVRALVDAGVPVDAAMRIAGFDEDEIASTARTFDTIEQ